MASDATIMAVSRLESALKRIEAVAARVAQRNAVELPINELKARHEALRREATTARDEIARIIAAEPTEGHR